ncbi:hypothetical protein DM52_2199 [Burkholderia mallei]|nr:hypothetical protein DM52_2199 [Burkholderia mallei]
MHDALEHEPAVLHVDRNHVLRPEAAREDQLRDRILDLLLDRALERPRTEQRIVADLADLLERGLRHVERHVELREPVVQTRELNLRDRLDVAAVERVEHDDVVDPVQELGAEVLLDLDPHRILDLFLRRARHRLDQLRAEIRRHHDHGVLEVDGAPLPVRHPAVVEHLQQHVEHVRVRLLDLVEQDHAVRLATHGFGQIAAFLVADVAGRRADQPRDAVLLHELAHVDADQMLFRIEQEAGERLAQLGLAHARRAEEQERAVRTVRIGEARARAADRVGDRVDRLVLADHALMQLLFDVQQLLALALHHPRHRNARRARDDLGNFLRADLRAQQARPRRIVLLALLGLRDLLEPRLELRQLAVLQLGDLLELAFALQARNVGTHLVDLFLQLRTALHGCLLGRPDLVEIRVFAPEPLDFLLDQRKTLLRRFVRLLLHRFALDLQLDQTAIELVHFFGLRVDFHLDPRRGLVNQIDCLVGQEAVGDVAVREFRRGDDRRIGDLDAVMQFVLLLQPAQDRDRRLDARLVDEHLLEAALERGILLDVLAVFVERRRADAVQLAARQRGLEHVARVHRAFGLARTDHRMDLVDEDDRAALVLRDVVEHRLQTLLELAAILRAGEQRRHVERQHALVLQRLGHLAVDDPLREPFDDRGLADARLTDQHRIVLRAALQDLDRAANLVVAADHRIELARARALGQIDRVFLQRLALALGILAVHLRAAAHRGDRGFERAAREAVLARELAGFALVVGHREQEHLARDERVVQFLRFLVGLVQQAREFTADLDVAARARHLRQARDRFVERALQRLDVHARTRQQRARGAVLLRDERGQHVDGFDVLVVAPGGETLRIRERLLEFGGELVDSHE